MALESLSKAEALNSRAEEQSSRQGSEAVHMQIANRQNAATCQAVFATAESRQPPKRQIHSMQIFSLMRQSKRIVWKVIVWKVLQARVRIGHLCGAPATLADDGDGGVLWRQPSCSCLLA